MKKYVSKPTVAVTSQADFMVAACTCCMWAEVSSLSRIYLYLQLLCTI